MKYYDQHLHTHHSFDSEETFENYLTTYSPEYFVSTEHLDFKNPCVGGKDSIPDYTKYATEIDTLNQHYPTKLLKGIEVGFVDTQKELIDEFLSDKDYDVILLSIHQNGIFDYMDDDVLSISTKDLINDYYSRMLDAVKTVDYANILTHFDYGMRRLDLSIDEFKQYAEPYLIDIFKLIIKKNMALELNAKSFVKYHNQALYEYAIPLYISLGGTLFTLGSDAHVCADYRLGFDEMTTLLKNNGIDTLATFQNQTMKLTSI